MDYCKVAIDGGVPLEADVQVTVEVKINDKTVKLTDDMTKWVKHLEEKIKNRFDQSMLASHPVV
jgi:predicted nucleic acid-binding Zn ribbon protein